MKLFRTLIGVLWAFGLMSVSSTQAQTAKENAINLITTTSYAMVAKRDGAVIPWNVMGIKYLKDGSAMSTLKAGIEVKVSWSLDDTGKVLTMVAPGQGETRWEILELSPNIFRKRNIVSGVEAVQTPKM